MSAQQHPGNRVSAECLRGLLQAAEQRLGCYPRRRPELVQQRLPASQQKQAEWDQKVTQRQQQIETPTQRLRQLAERIQQATQQIRAWQRKPLSTRQAGPSSKLSRLPKQRKGWRRQQKRAQARLIHLQARAPQAQAQQQAQAQEVIQLQARYDRRCQDNARQSPPPRCKIRLDAGFSWGVNLTELIELGYDLDELLSEYLSLPPDRRFGTFPYAPRIAAGGADPQPGKPPGPVSQPASVVSRIQRSANHRGRE